MGLDVTGRYRYPPPDPAWLSGLAETVIDPDLPIVDAHHHLWEEAGHPYLLREILADVGDGHRIEATVFVQAHYGYRTSGPPHLAPVGETEKVVQIAAAAQQDHGGTRVAAAIIGFADLMLGRGVEEVLDAHAEVAGRSFRGVRHSVSRDPLFPNGIVLRPSPEGMLVDPRYREGLRTVAAYGLRYDAMLYHRQLPELCSVAQAIPELPIILDHAGCIIGVGPYEGRERETFGRWRRDMAELARNPNVTVKLGGFGMIITGARWHERDRPPRSDELAEAWRPYVEACIELFGADRCMFESNFPVDKAMYSYRTLWNAFKRLTSGASADERKALFAGTAARVYGITARTSQSAEAAAHA